MRSQRKSKLCKETKVTLVEILCRTHHDPTVRIVWRGELFDFPIQIVDKECDGFFDSGQVVVIQDYDAALLHDLADVKQINKHIVEAVIAVNEGKIEAAAFLQKARQCEL